MAATGTKIDSMIESPGVDGLIGRSTPGGHLRRALSIPRAAVKFTKRETG
jgi:hypothetical protein